MKFLIGLFLTVFSITAFSATPYSPEINRRFKTLEALPSNLAYTTNGIGNLRVARVAFDSTTQGSSSATAHSLGVTLPAKSLIWSGVVYTTSTFTTAGTVALECEDSKNIMADKSGTTMSSAGTKIALTPVGTAASAVGSIAADCAISARVSGADVVGKFNAWVFYMVTD